MNVTAPSVLPPQSFSTSTRTSIPAVTTAPSAVSAPTDSFERVGTSKRAPASSAIPSNDFASVLKEVQAERMGNTFNPQFPSTPIGELAEFGVIASKLQEEAAMNLQPGSRSGFLKSKVEPARGVVLALHGWSAGTWQFEHLAAQLSERGYHVYAPRLPGHGYLDAEGNPTAKNFPQNNEAHRFREFADQAYAEVKSVGLPVSIVGLSGGGAVGLDIAGRYDDIESATLYDPFLSPAYPTLPLVHAALFLDKFTFGAASYLLRMIPVVFGGAALNRIEWGRDGHTNFDGGMIFGLSKFGRQAAEAAKDSKVPMQLVSSDYQSNVVSRQMIYDVNEVSSESRGWYHYPTESEVTHPMLHWREFGNDESRAHLRKLTFDFLESHEPQTHNQPARVLPSFIG